MDKHFIHIDDLVRQRMTGAEEEERPGAWLRMRELLDKNMPEDSIPPVGFNWRRMFSYMAVCILAASFSVGGYEMYQSTHKNDRGTQALASNAIKTSSSQHYASKKSIDDQLNTTATSNNEIAASTVQSSMGGSPVAEKINTPVVAANVPAMASNNAPTNTVDKSATDANDNTATPATNKKSNTVSSNNANHNNNNTNHTTKAALIASNTSSVAHQAPATINNEEKTTNEKTAPVATPVESTLSTASVTAHKSTHMAKIKTHKNTTVQNNVTPAVFASSVNVNTVPAATMSTEEPAATVAKSRKHVIAPAAPVMTATIAPKHTVAKHTTAAETIRPMSSASVAKANITPAENVGNKATPTVTRGKDSIRKMEVVQRYTINPLTNVVHYYADTIAVGYIVFDKPATKEEPVIAAATETKKEHRRLFGKKKTNVDLNTPDTDIKPAASAKIAKSGAVEDAASEHTSNTVVAAKEAHKLTRMDIMADRMNDFMKEVKFNVAHAIFYPGVVAGINASFLNSNMLGGFQFGLSALFAFDEHWSLLSELKYLQRTNNGQATIDDSYAQYDPSSTTNIGPDVNHPNYHITGTAAQHYFNYSLLSSLDMPIMLRYSIKNFNILAGIDLGYNFSINSEEKTIKTAIDEYSTTPPPVIAGVLGAAKISTADFQKAIFGTGYVVGVGYQLSPAFQVDVRFSHLFFDNASGQGAKAISTNLYGVPAMQINLGYRFHSDKKR
ncbi:MAG: outer membrane beta-barrel protein [Bacteroidota bacterium]